MKFAEPTHKDKFPNRGRWAPAHWKGPDIHSISWPAPKETEYKVYADVNETYDPQKFIGTIKVENFPGSSWAAVYYYPALYNPDGYENGLIYTYPGYKPAPQHDFYETIELAPRLLAVVKGKTKNKILARARREALYLSQEPDAIGTRILAPLVIEEGRGPAHLAAGPALAEA